MGKDLKGKELGTGLSQRKDGRYEARAMINGKRINLYDFDLAQLKYNFEKEKKLIKENKQIDKKEAEKTLKEWYQEWFKNIKSPQLKTKVSRNTYDRKIRNTYISILGDKKLKDIMQMDIQIATNELCAKNYVDRTISEALGVLRDCLDIAVLNRYISCNPCVNIHIKTTGPKADRRVLTKKEQDIFLQEVENNYYCEAYKILLLTGMRIGEFSGLQWEDIDFDKKTITIQRSMSTGYFDGVKIEELTTPKTFTSFRVIPFFGETEQCFKSWKKKQDMYKKKLGNRWRANPDHGNLVFTSTMGSPVTRYVLAHDLNKVSKDISLKYNSFEHLHPHAFRHTFATRCMEKGLDPIFVQRIMGHSNYNTTLSYTHVLDEVVNTQVIKAGNFFE